jgi:hypothetical protein
MRLQPGAQKRNAAGFGAAAFSFLSPAGLLEVRSGGPFCARASREFAAGRH